jgi:hypothetical protein
MTDTALFIGWGRTIPGREHHALKLYEETIELLDAAVKAGEIDGYEPVLLEPHGGELEGFILVKGSVEKLAAFQAREDAERLRIEASAFKTDFGVVFATTGEAVKNSYELFVRVVDEVVKEPIGV